MKNDGNRRRTVPRQRVGRPEPRTPMERAQRIADDRDGMRAMYERACDLEARLRSASEQEVIAMWGAGRNEKGEALDAFQLEALAEPPFDDADGGNDAKAPAEPADDTIIHKPEVHAKPVYRKARCSE